MNTAVSKGTLSGEFLRFIETGVADDHALASGRIQRDPGWPVVIDQLIEWAINPEGIADAEENIPAPTGRIIALAGKAVTFLQNAGLSVPQRIITDGEGGIVFEWWGTKMFQTVRMRANETVEALLFSDAKLISRFQLEIQL